MIVCIKQTGPIVMLCPSSPINIENWHLFIDNNDRILFKRKLFFTACVFAWNQNRHLRTPPKSEFVEKERKIKNPLFRHFIYVNLRTAVEVCKNLLFTYKKRIKTAEKHKILLSPT